MHASIANVMHASGILPGFFEPHTPNVGPQLEHVFHQVVELVCRISSNPVHQVPVFPEHCSHDRHIYTYVRECTWRVFRGLCKPNIHVWVCFFIPLKAAFSTAFLYFPRVPSLLFRFLASSACLRSVALFLPTSVAALVVVRFGVDFPMSVTFSLPACSLSHAFFSLCSERLYV